MKWIYALLSILGFALPYSCFVPFVPANGLNVPRLLSQLFTNDMSIMAS